MLVFTQVRSIKATNQSKIQSLSQLKKHNAIYVLKYYYEEQPDKILFTSARGRAIKKDGSFCLVEYDPADVTKVTYTSCFDPDGIPTQFGSGNEITKITKDSLTVNFKGKDTTFFINAEKRLKDPTALWFWKHRPKLNETVIVAGVRKNFTTKSVDLVNVSYTYEGKENINVLGKTQLCYKVKSVSLNGSTGIYDERWFDDNGMIVREKHVVGKDGIRVSELIRIID